MDKKVLKKANEDIFFEAERLPENDLIYLNWIGLQTMETIVMGGNKVLSMLKERPSRGILNSNRELVGPWDHSIKWLNYKWAPEASKLGVKYFAHVLSHGIYGRKSFDQLSPLLKEHFIVKSFEDEDNAILWLKMKLNTL